MVIFRTFSIILAVSCGVGCVWRSSPLPPSPCSRLSVELDGSPGVRGAAALSNPFTVVLDGEVLDTVQVDTARIPSSSTHRGSAELRGIDPASIKSVAIIPARVALERWPNAVGDVLEIRRCHEPPRSTSRLS